MHRIGVAKESSGHIIQYEYDNAGRLTHVRDSQDGEEFYQYDPINRLTAVLDEKRRPVLLNVYGYMGEITSQTLADGRKLSYEYGWDENHRPYRCEFTDPNGYTIQCWQVRGRSLCSLPERPREK